MTVDLNRMDAWFGGSEKGSQRHFCDDICAHDHLVITTIAVGDGDADTACGPFRIALTARHQGS
jgi:hypothetical protein